MMTFKVITHIKGLSYMYLPHNEVIKGIKVSLFGVSRSGNGVIGSKHSQFMVIFRKKSLLSLTPLILVDYSIHIDTITME